MWKVSDDFSLEWYSVPKRERCLEKYLRCLDQIYYYGEEPATGSGEQGTGQGDQ